MARLKKICSRILIGLLGLFFAVTVYKLIFQMVVPDKLPSFFGYSHSLVFSGSMEPTLSTGDMVICKEQDGYQINDIIVYYDEQENEFVLHRIIGNGADGFITKGDFNPDQDPAPVKMENVQGKMIFAIPNVKTFRDIAIGALLVLVIQQCVKLIVDICKEKKKGGEEADEET